MKDRVDVKKPLQVKPPGPRAPEPVPPAQATPAGKMKDAGKEAQPRQPDRPAGWSTGGTFPEWGPLDLSGGGGKLPLPGDYDGVIADLELIDKSVVLWMVVSLSSSA